MRGVWRGLAAPEAAGPEVLAVQQQQEGEEADDMSEGQVRGAVTRITSLLRSCLCECSGARSCAAGGPASPRRRGASGGPQLPGARMLLRLLQFTLRCQYLASVPSTAARSALASMPLRASSSTRRTALAPPAICCATQPTHTVKMLGREL